MSNESEQLFQELMRFKPDGLTANAWAVKAGVSRTIWADLRRHGNPSRRTLEKLLGAAGSSLAEFEALRITPSAEQRRGGGAKIAESGRDWPGASAASLPLFATSLAGQWGDADSSIDVHSIDRSSVLATIDRPIALAGDREAYAVTMVGDSMWPRFRSGRRLLVSPAALIAVGDDVMVQLAGGKAMIKELVSRSVTRLELRQFNPAVTFSVEAAAPIHKILGEAI